MERQKIIIDTDPGQDDAVAILLALASPEELEVLGIVAVAGNVGLAQNARNALKIVELSGRRDVAVYAGSIRPMRRTLFTAEAVHAGAVAHPHVGAEPTVTAEPAEPLTGAARFAAASGLYHRGQLEEAAEALLPLAHDAHLQAAVRRDAANLLGDIYKGWRRLDDAASEYDRACGLGSDESCYSLGGVAENLDQNDRARVAYRAYLHRAPDGALALQARARLCRPLGVSEACYGSVITPYTP